MNLKIDPRIILPGNVQPKATTKQGNELQSLRNSCREFEAIYVNELYKSMRKTVPESGLFEKKGVAEDVYREMLDMEMARKTAAGDGIGIGKAMYQQMHKKYYNEGK